MTGLDWFRLVSTCFDRFLLLSTGRETVRDWFRLVSTGLDWFLLVQTRFDW